MYRTALTCKVLIRCQLLLRRRKALVAYLLKHICSRKVLRIKWTSIHKAPSWLSTKCRSVAIRLKHFGIDWELFIEYHKQRVGSTVSATNTRLDSIWWDVAHDGKLRHASLSTVHIVVVVIIEHRQRVHWRRVLQSNAIG